MQSSRLRVDDPPFKEALADVTRRVSRVAVVRNVQSPAAVSPDRHSALVQFDIRGDSEKAVDKVDPVLAQVAAAQRTNPELRIEQFGDASADKELNGVFADDLHKAETPLAPDHARDPADRVRCARRRRVCRCCWRSRRSPRRSVW